MATSIKTIKNHLTDDTIYPVTKANAVYLSDEVTTVEGLLGDTSITSIGDGTITGAISALNSNLNSYNIYTTKEITLTTQTIASQNAGTWDYDISSQIPNGYNKIFLMTGCACAYQCYFYTCYPYSNTYIRVQVKNATNTEVTVTPRIWCVFSKY